MLSAIGLIAALAAACILAISLQRLGSSYLVIRFDRSGRVSRLLPRIARHRRDLTSDAKTARLRQAYRLTGPQLTETCYQFAGVMGWITPTPGADWYDELLESGGPEAFYEAINSAMREAIERAAAQDNTSTEALRRFQHSWRERHGE